MVDARTEHVERIHELVSQDGYEVDAGAVAEAIVRRLLGGRCLDVPPSGPEGADEG